MERFQLKLGVSCQKLPLTLSSEVSRKIFSQTGRSQRFQLQLIANHLGNLPKVIRIRCNAHLDGGVGGFCRTTQNYKSNYKKPVESEIGGFVFFSKWKMCWDSIEKLSSPRRSHHDHENSRALRPQDRAKNIPLLMVISRSVDFC